MEKNKKPQQEPTTRPAPKTPKPVTLPKPEKMDEDDAPFDEEKDRRDGWAVFGVWL